ncbi:MAG: prepilin-type cleavage/methylation domain-containing protein [Meiothermus sp.]|nr:prepilin-type cleavage/methylation domain-containing protein [Meiothermus sp.]
MSTRGLTIIEVLIAIICLAVALTALNASMVGSIVQNSSTGQLSQAIQIVNYLGRRISGRDLSLLPSTTTTPLNWAYGSLRTNFPDLPQAGNFGNLDGYRATITNRGNWSHSAAPNIVLTQYRIQVCWRTTEAERCTDADTLGFNQSNGAADVIVN